MSTFQKIAVVALGVAFATTLVLPGRQTPQVVNSLTGLSTGTLSTVMGTSAGTQLA